MFLGVMFDITFLLVKHNSLSQVKIFSRIKLFSVSLPSHEASERSLYLLFTELPFGPFLRTLHGWLLFFCATNIIKRITFIELPAAPSPVVSCLSVFKLTLTRNSWRDYGVYVSDHAFLVFSQGVFDC